MTRIGLLFLLFPLPTPALAQSTVNKATLRTQDQLTTERQLKEQLWGIFEPVDERRREGNPAPTVPLERIWLHGKSYATEVSGLCRQDTIMLNFAPQDAAADRSARTPVRAYGIDASRGYYFRKPPQGWHRDVTDYERMPWEPECEGLDWRETNFFSAPNDETAVDGYYAMHLAARAVAAGEVEPKCGGMGPYEKRSCGDIMAEFVAGTVSDIESCAVAAEIEATSECYQLSGGWDMRVRAVVDRDKTVRSVQLDAMIVLIHERPD